MKKRILLIIICILLLSITGCTKKEENLTKEIKFSEDLSEKLNNTNKVIVKTDNKELGFLQNQDIIDELLKVINESKIYGEVFLTDAPTIKLEMYNNKDLIETINLFNDGVRLNIKNQGGYYTANKDIRVILEKEIDYKFIALYHLSDECDNTSQLIYEDSNNQYYYNCSTYGIVQISFLTTNKLMDLKYALENNYINIEQLLIYDNLIIKIKKEPQNEELVKIKDYIPDIIIDLKYATNDNFTKQIIYENNEAFLRYGTIKKLIKVQNELNKKGYTLVIWDAYRSVENQFKLWNAYPDANYVSNPNTGYSSHSKGNTVDITIKKSNGNSVEMPSEFDNFTKLADRDYSDISNTAKENILLLESIMYSNGFKGYQKEWWHYTDSTDYEIIK